MHSVLFICTANQCRSPLAEGLLRLRVGLDNPAWRISSAGTWAEDGAPITYNSQLVLEKRGLDLSEHQSCSVDQELIEAHQLILTMTRSHKEALRIEFSQAVGRIFLLSEMVDRVYDIADPVGQPYNAYAETAEEIEMILEQGYAKILALSQEAEDRPR